MRQITINSGTFYTRIAVTVNREIQDFRLDQAGKASNVGKIYKGRVADVIPGMEAAFVDIGLGKNAYLSKMDMVKNGRRGQKQDRLSDLVKTGDEILVEVVKDATGTKGAKISMRLGLTGKSMVLMPEEGHVGISKQIDDAEAKERLKAWIQKSDMQGHGLILRTSAKGLSEAELDIELRILLDKWVEVERYKVLGQAPMCIDQGDSFVVSSVRSEFKNKVDEIVCDSKDIFNEVRAYLKLHRPEWVEKVKCYSEPMPIFDAFGISEPLRKMTGRQVDLSGGAYLIIDETEALTVIDVNSGQNVGKIGMDKTAFDVNMKAAKMVAKLLKVRELSGIVLIDFIDMNDRELQKKLVGAVEKLTLSDRNRVTVHGLTKLGILEITRKKSVDSFVGRTGCLCSVCGGSGVIAGPEYTVEGMLSDMKYHRHHTDAEAVLYEVSSEVESFIIQNRDRMRRETEKIGFELYLITGLNEGFKRLRAESEEKLMDFAKKTRNLIPNNI